MTMKADFIRGVSWTAVQKIATRASSLVTVVILGRTLEAEAFGLVALAMVFISLSNVIVDLGASTYVVQVARTTQVLLDSVYAAVMFNAVSLAAGLALLAPLLADLFGAADLTNVLRVLALSLIINAASTVHAAILRRNLQFRQLTVRTVAANAAAAGIAIALALQGGGVWALVAQYLVTGVVGLAILWRSSSYRPGRSVSRAEFLASWKYGWSVAGTGLTVQVQSQGINLIIGAALGPAALGVFVIASRVTGVVLDLFLSVLGPSAMPVFAKYRDDPRQLARGYVKAVNATTAIAGFPLALLAGTTSLVIPILFGPGWDEAVVPAALLAASSVVYCASYFDRPMLITVGGQRLMLVIALADAAATLALCLALSPLGLVAIVLGRAVMNVVTAVMHNVAVAARTSVVLREQMTVVARNALLASVAGAVSTGVVLAAPVGDAIALLVLSAGSGALAWTIAVALTSRHLIVEAVLSLRTVGRVSGMAT